MDGMKTCNNCGWVHFGVTRAHAESEVASFKVYFDTLDKEKQDEWYDGKPSSIKDYDSCHRCSSSCTNFRDAKYGDSPDGCTIGPIIVEDKK